MDDIGRMVGGITNLSKNFPVNAKGYSRKLSVFAFLKNSSICKWGIMDFFILIVLEVMLQFVALKNNLPKKMQLGKKLDWLEVKSVVSLIHQSNSL